MRSSALLVPRRHGLLKVACAEAKLKYQLLSRRERHEKSARDSDSTLEAALKNVNVVRS
jgi:hypothetical protein